LLFAEHQSLRAVLAGESHRIRSALLAELQTLRSAIVDDAQAVRSEAKEQSQLAHEEMDRLGQALAAQAGAIRSLQGELARVREGLALPTWRRWLGRSDV